jgi:pimeloyl-ACP methyl ester carboxylesterase
LKEHIFQKDITLSKPDKSIRVSYLWKPSVDDIKNVLLILPGLDESMGDYEKFFNEISSLLPNYSLLSIDMRGQGKTLEDESRFQSLSITVDHQITIIKKLLADLNVESVFIIGLSYGAGVGLCLANHLDNVEGLALLAPYVSKFKNFNRGFSGVWYTLAHMNPFYKTLSYFSLPFYFQLAQAKGRLNPAVKWDPKRMSALTKLSTGIMRISTTKEARKLKGLPKGVHFLIGKKDDLVSLRAVEHLLNQIQTEKKSLEIIPNGGHRLLINDFKECSLWISGIVKA